MRFVKLADIEPAEDNLRTSMTDIEELAVSIQVNGVLTPITLTTNGTNGDGVSTNGDHPYKVVAGHRRRAAIAWLAEQGRINPDDYEIPALVRVDLQDATRIQAMVVENIQRQDLNPIEEANGYARLRDEFGLRQDDIAERVGRHQSHVSKRMLLLNLEPRLQAHVAKGTLVVETAQLLAKLDPETQVELIDIHGPGIEEWRVNSAINRAKAAEALTKFSDKAIKAGLPVVTKSELTSDYVMTGDSFTTLADAKEFVKGGEWHEDMYLVAQDSAGTPCLRVFAPKAGKTIDGGKGPEDPESRRKRMERLVKKFWLEAVIGVVTRVTKSKLSDTLIRSVWQSELSYSNAGDVVRVLNLEPYTKEERSVDPITGEVKVRNVRDYVGTARAYAELGDKQFIQSVTALMIVRYGWTEAVKELLESLGVPSEEALRTQAEAS